MRKPLSGWQKAGIFAGVGCLSIVALVVIAISVAVVWARSTIANLGDPTPKRVERTITLQAPPAPAADRAGTRNTTTTRTDPLGLSLDLEGGSFDIRPGPPGSDVQVQGTYAEGLYDLAENHETDESGRPRRTTIRFRSKVPGWARIFGGVGNDSETRPNLTVLIPEGVPIDLSLRISAGESRVDLGGLTLRELGLDLSMGDHRVDFRKPVVEGLRHVRLSASMGNVSVDNFGNAGARTIDASGNMGNLTADLGGAWQPEAGTELSFTHSMGEVTVRVPEKVRLETQITSQGKTENRPAEAEKPDNPNAPLVRLRVTSSMGDSHIVRY
jgi:hypothetical protein